MVYRARVHLEPLVGNGSYQGFRAEIDRDGALYLFESLISGSHRSMGPEGEITAQDDVFPSLVKAVNLAGARLRSDGCLEGTYDVADLRVPYPSRNGQMPPEFIGRTLCIQDADLR